MNANMLQVTTPQSRLPELIAAAGERAWHGGGSRATRALRAELAEAGSFVTLRWRGQSRANPFQLKFPPTPRNRELISPYQGIKSAYQGSFQPDQGRVPWSGSNRPR